MKKSIYELSDTNHNSSQNGNSCHLGKLCQKVSGSAQDPDYTKWHIHEISMPHWRKSSPHPFFKFWRRAVLCLPRHILHITEPNPKHCGQGFRFAVVETFPQAKLFALLTMHNLQWLNRLQCNYSGPTPQCMVIASAYLVSNITISVMTWSKLGDASWHTSMNESLWQRGLERIGNVPAIN